MRELKNSENTGSITHVLIARISKLAGIYAILNDHHTNSLLGSMLSCETMLSPLAMTHWKLQ